MISIQYQPKHHNQIIHSCVKALKQGKAIAYPTDTSYGLAVDALNIKAIKKLYKIKGRDYHKPVHVVVPSVNYAKRIVVWDRSANKFANKFWPGPLTLVLGLKSQNRSLRQLTAKTGFLGVRMPKNPIALDLAKALKRPITATSANVSGMPDCYSTDDIFNQFKNKRYRPDFVLNAGKLPRRKPSTLVRIESVSHKLGQRSGAGEIVILRQGQIRKVQILKKVKT